MRLAQKKAGILQTGHARGGSAARMPRASGGRVSGGGDPAAPDGAPSAKRLDRSPRGKSGTNVNIIVAPKAADTARPAMPLAPPVPAAAMPPPAPPLPMARPPAGVPPGMPMRARGGRVNGWEGSAKDVAEDRRLAKTRGMSLKDWEKSAADKRHDAGKARGGRVWEGSAKDLAEDRRLAKTRGMSLKDWEKSAADVKHDRGKANGGRVKLTGGGESGVGRLERARLQARSK